MRVDEDQECRAGDKAITEESTDSTGILGSLSLLEDEILDRAVRVRLTEGGESELIIALLLIVGLVPLGKTIAVVHRVHMRLEKGTKRAVETDNLSLNTRIILAVLRNIARHQRLKNSRGTDALADQEVEDTGVDLGELIANSLRLSRERRAKEVEILNLTEELNEVVIEEAKSCRGVRASRQLRLRAKHRADTTENSRLESLRSGPRASKGSLNTVMNRADGLLEILYRTLSLLTFNKGAALHVIQSAPVRSEETLIDTKSLTTDLNVESTLSVSTKSNIQIGECLLSGLVPLLIVRMMSRHVYCRRLKMCFCDVCFFLSRLSIMAKFLFIRRVI